MKTGEVEEQEIIVGIDLGTTNSLVAYVQDGTPHIVKDTSGKTALVPSIIHFSEDNSIVVGESAKHKLVTHPERTIYSVKRLMGKSHKDVSNYENLLSYEIIDEEDKLIKIKVDDAFHTPINLSAEILKYLKQRIETHLSKKVSKAVITVPAYFNDAQRQATRDAGKIAGLDVLRIINEPTAASLAYGYGIKDSDPEVIAVYDLGGGTFDISILKLEHGVFDVLSTNGDTFLGGDDFDRAIIDYWISEDESIAEKLNQDKSYGQAIRLRAEEAKKALSASEEYISEDNSLRLSKEKFESLIKDIVSRTIDKSKEVLKDAGLTVHDINNVIMLGGSTRTPLVKKMVGDFFERQVNDNINPDEVVAIGAAIQADILAGNSEGYLLLDVTPLSLGIETMGGLMDPIIHRNSKVPASAGRSYTTSVDGQKNLKVAVYQGERELVEHNRKLGEFILSDIPPMAAGIPKILVQFILDADGILKVRAVEERSGKETEVTITSQYGISEEEMGKMLIDSLQNAESDMKIKALLEAKNEANSIVLSANKFIKQNSEILTEEEILRLQNDIEKLESAIEKADKDGINLAMKNLNDYSAPLAERAMNYNIKKALSGKTI
jgi:molecular chaperone HscA